MPICVSPHHCNLIEIWLRCYHPRTTFSDITHAELRCPGNGVTDTNQ